MYIPYEQPETLLLLSLTAFVAGVVDTIAGGGGLLTIPALLISQVPPLQALGTGKLQSASGSLTATLSMLRHGHLQWQEMWKGGLLSFIGGAVGAYSVQFLDPHLLDFIIPILLLGIMAYFLFAPRAGEVEGHVRLSQRMYERYLIPWIGLYDGVLGPGTGSFFALCGTALRGLRLIHATAFAKAFNCASNMGALLIFVMKGKILWMVGGCMIIGQISGAYVGAHLVVNGGARFIRPVIIGVCFCMLIRYIYQKFL